MRFLSFLQRALCCLLPFVLLSFANFARAGNASPQIRLYTLDCGHLHFQDMRMFDDSGALDGKPGAMSAPCFLIVHPKGILLWDTGLGDATAAHTDGIEMAPPPFEPLEPVRSWRTAHTRIIDGDADVFGDGTLRLLLMPGHTPGHQALEGI